MNLSFKKMVVRTTSAVAGGLAVLAALKMNPALQVELNGNAIKAQKNDVIYEDLLKNQNGNFAGKSQSRSNPFDIWFSDKFGGGIVYDISKREDDGFVYYDIKVDDLDSTSINPKVENGYITITGSLAKENEGNREDEKDKLSSHYIYKSTFNRTFQLPENVNAGQMQRAPAKNKIVLKFPKVNA